MMTSIYILCTLLCLYNIAQSYQIAKFSSCAIQRQLVRGKYRFALASSTDNDDVFGAEFSTASSFLSQPAYNVALPPSQQMKLDRERKEMETAIKAKESFTNFRSTFLGDSVFVSLLGFSAVWYLGTFKDSYSFAIGSFLGILYSILLGRYVEKLGTGEKNRFGDAIRFAPVVLLIALYGKLKLYISIVPELMGFFTSYQLASLLQIFNERAYEGKEEEIEQQQRDTL
jgi:hypothetical protein